LNPLFEELDYRPTPIGALSLRKRRELTSGRDIFEIKLGEEFLMSSLFTESEIALARLGLAALKGKQIDVVVGGLGLGYTAKAVLEHETVSSLIVVEMLEPVVEWHRTGLLPLGAEIVSDQRCRLVQGDFFAMSASSAGFDYRVPGRRFDAILVDIDHSPDAVLDDRSADFYQRNGFESLSRLLKPEGIFGLWSNDLPHDSFVNRLLSVFAEAWAEPVAFHNPLQDKPFTQTIYIARNGE
jgi:spermidine synthase